MKGITYTDLGMILPSTTTLFYEDEIGKEAMALIRQYDQIGATNMNETLHSKLKEQLMETIEDIKDTMVSRFAIILPYDEMQSMLMSSEILSEMQITGKYMGQQYTNYEYKLGDKVTIRINCHGGSEMPTILFPNSELTMFSEDFLDLVRPLYSITKSWVDVKLAFNTVCALIQDTRELNFFVPWLRYLFPESKDLTNEFNAQFRITNWLGLSREKASTITLITKQIRQILNNEHTNKRTWMPSELVQMVRQGEELITQYNIMKTVPVPDTFVRADKVRAEVIINTKDHPTTNWMAEASSHLTMNRVNKMLEENKGRKSSEWI
jgi:hypothetical protein